MMVILNLIFALFIFDRMLVLDLQLHLSFEFSVLNSPKLSVPLYYLGKLELSEMLIAHLMILISKSKFDYLVFMFHYLDFLLHVLKISDVLILYLKLLLLYPFKISMRKDYSLFHFLNLTASDLSR